MELKEFIENSEIIKKETENVYKKLEKYFHENSDENLREIFSRYVEDRNIISFINWYNETVLDHNTINFGTFKRMWSIQGMKESEYTYFDTNYKELENEIIKDKDIFSFYCKHCCQRRKEFIFCCKLFHMILPNEFPIADNQILRYFRLIKYEKIFGYCILKLGYDKYLKEDTGKIEHIRKILSEEKYEILRINESSNYRIFDIIFWYITNRFEDIVNRLP